jgi:hypothetical protein
VRPPTQYFGSKGRLAPWIASLTAGGRAVRAVEAVWSNRPLRQQLALAGPAEADPLTEGVQP